MGRGKGGRKGPELGTCLEYSRRRKTTGILEPEREGDGTKGKQGRQAGRGLVSYLLSDLGKSGKVLGRGVQDPA